MAWCFLCSRQSVVGGKRNIPVCEKIHSEVIQEKFEKSKDGKEGSELRNKYEACFKPFLRLKQ